jgi:predicted RND superfamily exporter protein
MTTQTKTENQTGKTGRSSSADTALGFAVLGLEIAGTIGVVKALSMSSGLDVLFCLLGSVTAFGAVYYIYYGKR